MTFFFHDQFSLNCGRSWEKTKSQLPETSIMISSKMNMIFKKGLNLVKTLYVGLGNSFFVFFYIKKSQTFDFSFSSFH